MTIKIEFNNNKRDVRLGDFTGDAFMFRNLLHLTIHAIAEPTSLDIVSVFNVPDQRVVRMNADSVVTPVDIKITVLTPL